MGHLKEKYKKEYFLKKNADGSNTNVGVAGIEEFRLGTIRSTDKEILDRIDFLNKTVLDIGCGRGEAVKYAADLGAAKVMGIDFSEDAIDIAEAFVRDMDGIVEFHCADAMQFVHDYELSLGQDSVNKVDIVLMLDSVEHIPRSELTGIMNKLKGILSTRGLIAVNTPHFGADNDVIEEGLKDLAKDSSDIYETTAGMHCNRYTRNSFKSYMRKLGYYAISQHIFVINFGLGRLFEGTRWAREKAYDLEYPILMPQVHRKETYEGYSFRTYPILRPVRWLYRRCR